MKMIFPLIMIGMIPIRYKAWLHFLGFFSVPDLEGHLVLSWVARYWKWVMVNFSSPAVQAGGGIAQEICHFTGAGCCAKVSGLADAFLTASRGVNKSPLQFEMPEAFDDDPYCYATWFPKGCAQSRARSFSKEESLSPSSAVVTLQTCTAGSCCKWSLRSNWPHLVLNFIFKNRRTPQYLAVLRENHWEI